MAYAGKHDQVPKMNDDELFVDAIEHNELEIDITIKLRHIMDFF